MFLWKIVGPFCLFSGCVVLPSYRYDTQGVFVMFLPEGDECVFGVRDFSDCRCDVVTHFFQIMIRFQSVGKPENELFILFVSHLRFMTIEMCCASDFSVSCSIHVNPRMPSSPSFEKRRQPMSSPSAISGAIRMSLMKILFVVLENFRKIELARSTFLKLISMLLPLGAKTS